MKWYDLLLVAAMSGTIYLIVTVFISAIWLVIIDEDTDAFFFFAWVIGMIFFAAMVVYYNFC